MEYVNGCFTPLSDKILSAALHRKFIFVVMMIPIQGFYRTYLEAAWVLKDETVGLSRPLWPQG